jgi:hypothetical protein
LQPEFYFPATSLTEAKCYEQQEVFDTRRSYS